MQKHAVTGIRFQAAVNWTPRESLQRGIRGRHWAGQLAFNPQAPSSEPSPSHDMVEVAKIVAGVCMELSESIVIDAKRRPFSIRKARLKKVIDGTQRGSTLKRKLAPERSNARKFLRPLIYSKNASKFYSRASKFSRVIYLRFARNLFARE